MEARAIKSKATRMELYRLYRKVTVAFFPFEGCRSFDVIMFDVDNKDSTLGMSCPPAAFVEAPILQKVCSLLTPRGTESLITSLFV